MKAAKKAHPGKKDGNISDDMLKVLLDKAYALVLQGFSKKKQAEILQ